MLEPGRRRHQASGKPAPSQRRLAETAQTAQKGTPCSPSQQGIHIIVAALAPEDVPANGPRGHHPHGRCHEPRCPNIQDKVSSRGKRTTQRNKSKSKPTKQRSDTIAIRMEKQRIQYSESAMLLPEAAPVAHPNARQQPGNTMSSQCQCPSLAE